MNYRHAYHAGNFADVLKHAVLCWIVRYLQQKEAPLALIDTHAGPGLYDLAGPAAEKTGEAKDGILRLDSTAPAVLTPYLAAVAAANGGGATRLYPGSPMLLAHLARPLDRVVACERHPEDAKVLRVSAPRNVRVVEGDGYRTLMSLLPPREKRGLVLIDPPFEDPAEFERLAQAFVAAHRKWPTGVYVLWLPVKDDAGLARFEAELASAGIKKLLRVTLDVARAEGLRKTGLILCNAPYTFATEWRASLPALARALAQGEGAAAAIHVLGGDGP